MHYTYEQIQKVWEKANIVEGKDPDLWGADGHGILIYRHHYGNSDSVFGWDVCHIIPHILVVPED